MSPTVRRLAQESTSLTVVAEELLTAVRVADKVDSSEGVVALHLEAVDGSALPEWSPGSHVDVLIDDVATRQYSLSGDPQDRSRWRLGILRDENGRGSSKFIHDVLEVGDEIAIRGPRNNFPFLSSPRYLFIAGGIGITPILPMIRAAEDAGAEWRLVYGGRTRASMAFLDELAAYGDLVSVEPQDERGLLDLDTLLGTPQPDTLVYCCGPEPLLLAVEAKCAPWPGHSLRVERFTAKAMTEPQRSDSFEVVLEQSGQTVTVEPGISILEAVRTAGVGVLTSCEEGICGTCETRVIEGVPDHRDSILDDDEREANDCMMICVSRSLSSRLVLDL